ncbi:hypothetical protein [Nioella sp.]|uniref:hypothetical protein n=1 Tax=Nioella sp. TaxID=1912091 RepID=UPI003B52C1B8
MRRIASLFCTALNLGLTGPAIAHTAGPMLDAPTSAPIHLPAALAQDAPACHSAVFHAGQYPADPLSVDSITCLDASCDTREIILCTLTD